MNTRFSNITDDELLQRYYADGNNEWLGIILERYTLLLFGVCMKYLKQEEPAKDMVQQVFLKALSEAAKYRIENLGGWLYRVARNQCLTVLRDKKIFTGEEQLQYLEQPEEIPEQLHWQQVKDTERLRQSLESLKEEQKKAIVLFYLEKKSYAEIASLTGWEIGLVKSHIQNGKRNLKIKLDAPGADSINHMK